MKEQHFTARLDNLSRIISVVLVAGVIATTAVIAGVAMQEGLPEMIIAPVVVILLLGITALYAVTGYSITADGLVIHRRAGKKVILLSDIATATPVTSKELGFGIRTFGSGGFMGYFGSYAYRNIGKATMFVTDRTAMILITLRTGKQVIISPEEVRGFMSALDASLKK